MGRVDHPRYTKLLLKKATRRGLTPREQREFEELRIAKANAELEPLAEVINAALRAGYHLELAGLGGVTKLRSGHIVVVRGGQLFVPSLGPFGRWIRPDEAAGLAVQARRDLRFEKAVAPVLNMRDKDEPGQPG